MLLLNGLPNLNQPIVKWTDDQLDMGMENEYAYSPYAFELAGVTEPVKFYNLSIAREYAKATGQSVVYVGDHFWVYDTYFARDTESYSTPEIGFDGELIVYPPSLHFTCEHYGVDTL